MQGAARTLQSPAPAFVAMMVEGECHVGNPGPRSAGEAAKRAVDVACPGVWAWVPAFAGMTVIRNS